MNIASLSDKAAPAGHTNYSATKAGIVGMSTAAAHVPMTNGFYHSELKNSRHR